MSRQLWSTTARLTLQPISSALATPAASILKLAACVSRWVATTSAMQAYPASSRVPDANSSSAATGLVMMRCVSAWRISSSMTRRFGAMP